MYQAEVQIGNSGKGVRMMRYILFALAFVLTGCQETATVEVEDIGDFQFTTFSLGDLSLTYVEVDESMSVVYRRRADGGTETSPECLVCTISKISECADEVCPDGCDSDEILECCREKCEDDCEGFQGASFGSFAILR